METVNGQHARYLGSHLGFFETCSSKIYSDFLYTRSLSLSGGIFPSLPSLGGGSINLVQFKVIETNALVP